MRGLRAGSIFRVTMAELFVGAVAATSLCLLVRFARQHALAVTWWQWYFTGLAIVYAVFVVEVVIGFLREGNPKAGIVTGAILGFVAVVWGVLLARFVFRPTIPSSRPPPDASPRHRRATEGLQITDERRADRV